MAENEAVIYENAEIEGQQEGTAKKGSKLWLWIILALVVLGASAGAAWYFLVSAKAEQEAKTAEPLIAPKPQYLEMNPGFVVNLDDPDLMRYLQVEIQLMAYKASVLEEADRNMPQIRNRLLLLLGQQKFDDLVPRSGKEALQQAALAEINAVLSENGVKDPVEALYFTSFVMQ